MSLSVQCRYASLLAFAEARNCGREADGTFSDGNNCQIGININDSHQDFTGQILAGMKTTETRITNSLKPYVGKTVGIVRTGKGKATLVGTMKIGEPKFYKTKDEFDADADKHQVGPDSPHYIGSKGKYGYPLSEVKKVRPITLDTKGIIARVVSRDADEETIEYTLGPEPKPASRALCPTEDSESRSADCGRDEGGKFGPKNDCAADGSGPDAGLDRIWSDSPLSRGETVGQWLDRHKIKKEGDKYVFYHARPSGSDYETLRKGSYLADDPKDAAFFAARDRGLNPDTDVEVIKVLLHPDEINPGVHPTLRKPYAISRARASRAFCPTGDGGGIDNSCGSDSSPGKSDSSPSQGKASLPKSFPRGSEKIRDAIDSVSPNPKAIWDRARGRAETPSPQEMTQAANEQTSSGSALTPEAEKSYSALIDEIGRQYEALTEAGLKARAWKGEGEPYGDPPGSTKPNSDKMRAEVARTGDFSFFMTEKGFGTGAATPDHPMLRETKYKTADGEPMIANDLFRVVHDMVAHIRGGYSFSTNGEFNGMLTHASTLPESAWPALFAETFGQNAVYENTGNYAQQNAYASTVGPEIIRAELAKRNKKSSRAEDPSKDSDEPLGYQHIKSRPWLLESLAGVEKRAADCGANEEGGGGFQKGNTCATGEGGGDASARISSGEKPSKVLQSAGFKKMNFSGIERMLATANEKQKSRILSDLDSLVSAIKVEPRLADVPIRVGTISQIYKNSPELIKEAKQKAKEGVVVKASASADDLSIQVFTDDDPDLDYEDGWSTAQNSKEAVLVHEFSHVQHFQSMVKAFPYPGEEELPGVHPLDYAKTMSQAAADRMLKKDKSLRDKVKGVSKYATTDAFEFVAEYSTAVSLGDRDSDPDLDRLCKAVGAAVPRRTKK